MKQKGREIYQKKFEDLLFGEVFVQNRTAFMKVEETDKGNAVSLKDGSFVWVGAAKWVDHDAEAEIYTELL